MSRCYLSSMLFFLLGVVCGRRWEMRRGEGPRGGMRGEGGVKPPTTGRMDKVVMRVRATGLRNVM